MTQLKKTAILDDDGKIIGYEAKAKNIQIRVCKKKDADPIIIANHYSHKVTSYKAANYRQIDKIKSDFYILETGERVHPITMWHRHGTRKWAFLQEHYPNIKKSDGYQIKYVYDL